LIARGSFKKILFEGTIGGRGGAAGMPFVPADRPFAAHGRFDR
jgi:hypothetical protein